MSWIVYGIVLAAAIYQIAALAACLHHRFRKASTPPPRDCLPAVSILKPVRGLDPQFRESIRSHARQTYPQFEILFGLSDPGDPALPEIERLITEFPECSIRLIVSSRTAPNGKAAVLACLAEAARYEVLVVNDSDIEVPDHYLEQTVQTLLNPGVGIVTCLYEGRASTAPGHWEALGIGADFAPSVLVARWCGVREFGLGSTLAFRACDLRRIGGFEAIAEYLADDYQLARQITKLGYRSEISKTVVRTHVGDFRWREVWTHQVRWARTIRVSRPKGYLGLPVTHAGVWALAGLAFAMWQAAAVLVALRMAACAAAGTALGDRRLVFASILAPVWDLWAFAIWVIGMTGNTVEWRGRRIRVDAAGRILPANEETLCNKMVSLRYESVTP